MLRLLRFGSTYEGLKPSFLFRGMRAIQRFGSTYEGLKLNVHAVLDPDRGAFWQYL